MNCVAHASHVVLPLACLSLSLGFRSRAVVFCSAIGLTLTIANKIRAFRKCSVIYLSRQLVTFFFIGFYESLSQTLDQMTSISFKTPLWCWRTSAH